MPVNLRRFYLQQLQKVKKKEQEEMNKTNQAPSSGPPKFNR
jgi:hypothetical protein